MEPVLAKLREFLVILATAGSRKKSELLESRYLVPTIEPTKTPETSETVFPPRVAEAVVPTQSGAPGLMVPIPTKPESKIVLTDDGLALALNQLLVGPPI